MWCQSLKLALLRCDIHVITHHFQWIVLEFVCMCVYMHFESKTAINLECCSSEVFFVVVCICVFNEAESHWVALAGPEFTNVHLYYYLWTTLFSNSISLGPGACSSGYIGWVVSPRDPFFHISPLLGFQVWAFKVSSKGCTQVLMLEWQVLYQLS